MKKGPGCSSLERFEDLVRRLYGQVSVENLVKAMSTLRKMADAAEARRGASCTRDFLLCQRCTQLSCVCPSVQTGQCREPAQGHEHLVQYGQRCPCQTRPGNGQQLVCIENHQNFWSQMDHHAQLALQRLQEVLPEP